MKEYKLLLSYYGPQGWWPLSGRDRTSHAEQKPLLSPKHHNGPPLNEKDRFEIAVGAVLTQNTAWVNVEKAMENLNKSGLVQPEKMLNARLDTISQCIRPAGYYNQKARKLRLMAVFFSRLDGRIPERAELLQIWGVGPETADSILLYAFEKDEFVVDAYTKRVFSRLGKISEKASYDEIKVFFSSTLRQGGQQVFAEFHALIVAHAKSVCKTVPQCSSCVLRKNCKTGRQTL